MRGEKVHALWGKERERFREREGWETQGSERARGEKIECAYVCVWRPRKHARKASSGYTHAHQKLCRLRMEDGGQKQLYWVVWDQEAVHASKHRKRLITHPRTASPTC